MARKMLNVSFTKFVQSGRQNFVRTKRQKSSDRHPGLRDIHLRFRVRRRPRKCPYVWCDQDELLICTQIEDEVVRVMRDKFHRDPKEVRELLADSIPNAIRVIVTGRLSGVCRDPKDDFILECAETGKADLIVTGDKDLLSLKTYETIKILTPRQYLDDAGDQGGN
jgi:uncharacterized protein